jgi:hypothetical protein
MIYRYAFDLVIEDNTEEITCGLYDLAGYQLFGKILALQYF